MIDIDRYTGGILVVSRDDRQHDRDPACALRCAGIAKPTLVHDGNLTVATWGRLTTKQAIGSRLVVSGLARGPRADVLAPDLDLAAGMAGPHSMAELMPPFGAVQVENGTARAVTDALGYQHIYRSAGDGWSALSTSSIASHISATRGLIAAGSPFRRCSAGKWANGRSSPASRSCASANASHSPAVGPQSITTCRARRRAGSSRSRRLPRRRPCCATTWSTTSTTTPTPYCS